VVNLFFCLETKEPKIQGFNFFCYKILNLAKSFELAALKQQMILYASSNILLYATKFNALASIGCDTFCEIKTYHKTRTPRYKTWGSLPNKLKLLC